MTIRKQRAATSGRSLALIAGVALAAVALHAHVWAPARAHTAAAEAAGRLGVALEGFSGPEMSGSYVRGTRAYHWQRMLSAGDADGVDVLPAQGLACWWSRRQGRVAQHGCIDRRL